MMRNGKCVQIIKQTKTPPKIVAYEDRATKPGKFQPNRPIHDYSCKNYVRIVL